MDSKDVKHRKRIMWIGMALGILILLGAVFLIYEAMPVPVWIGLLVYAIFMVILISKKNSKINVSRITMLIGYTFLLSFSAIFAFGTLNSQPSEVLNAGYNLFYILSILSFVQVGDRELPKSQWREAKLALCGLWLLLVLFVCALFAGEIKVTDNTISQIEDIREWMLVILVPILVFTGYYVLRKIRLALLCWTNITLKLLFPQMLSKNVEVQSVLYRALKVVIIIALVVGTILVPSNALELILGIVS